MTRFIRHRIRPKNTALALSGIVLALAVFSCPLTVSAQEPATISLNEAIARALRASPRLEAAAAGVRASEGDKRQAGAWQNPELGVTAENFLGGNAYRNYRNAETTAQISQTIDTGKASRRKAVASEEVAISRIDQTIERITLIGDIRTAYANAVAVQERLKMAGEQKASAEKLLNEVSHRVSAAREPAIQKTKAQITLSAARFAHQKASRDLDYAKQVLASLWGGNEKKFALANSYFFAAEAPMAERQAEAALEKSVYLERMNAEQNRMQAIHRLEKAQTFGDPTVSLGVRDFRGDDSRAMVASVSFPLPILNQNSGAIDRARENITKSYSQKEALRLALKNELHEALGNMANAYENAINLKDSILPSARKAFAQSRQSYNEGKLPYLEVLDAQRTLADVHGQYIDTLNTYHKAKATVGRLTSPMTDDKDDSHE